MNEQLVHDVDPGRFLLCAPHPAERERHKEILEPGTFVLHECDSLSEARRLLLSHEFDVCILDPGYDPATVASLAGELNAQKRTTQIVHLVGDQSALTHSAAPSLHRVAVPQSPAQIRPVLTLARNMARSLGDIQRLRRQLQHRLQREMLGSSTAMQQLREHILSLAEKDDPVLILGEAGTGVTMCAQALHDVSRRAHRPFIKLRCSILSTEAIEAELFGRAERATIGLHDPDQPHSGLQHLMPGLLELAEGGTLLLQDIDCLSQPLQKKITRIFAEKRYLDPASGVTRRLNIRLIVTSHVDAEKLAANGLFREEGTAVLPFATLKTTPLHSRTEDIGLLTEHFLNCLATEEGRPPKMITLEALELLKAYTWPGNIRQLYHILDRACSVDLSTRLTAEMLRPWMEQPALTIHMESSSMSLKDMERKLIEATFTRFGGNRERTAQALQIGLRTLSGKLREYGYPPRGGPGSNRSQPALRAA
ncbi:MAG: sigma-54-dependent transcriptional regulator [Planctomycetaceae bacterium]